MTDFVIDDFMDYKLLPAPPGYTLWFVKFDVIGGSVDVIGWIVRRCRCSDGKHFFWAQEPVTAEEVVTEPNDYCIRFPDGRVLFPEGRIVDNMKKARAYIAERYRKDEARKRVSEMAAQ